MNREILIEVCANSVESALGAQEGGAHRVELCDNLYEGGTTPSLGAIHLARRKLAIDLFVIIRPRGGDFCYNDLEYEIMKEDIRKAKNAEVDGVVMGILLPDGDVDQTRVEELISLADPFPVTFHRAFDMTRDPWAALDQLKSLGITRILTSGQKNKAVEGMELLTKLVHKSNDYPIIMPGSSVNEETIETLIQQTGAREYHVSARRKSDSLMQYRNPDVHMGGLPDIPEYEKSITDPQRIRRIVEIAKRFST